MNDTPLKLKIELADQNHPIIRKVLIPDDLNLYQLHLVIQDAMGWFNSHLFEFADQRNKVNIRAGIPDEFDDFGTALIDVFKATVKELFELKNNAKPFWYTYDFGDNWEHKISFLKPTNKDRERFDGFPICTDAVGACPPEDVGGAWGYAEFLATINDKNHPEYRSTREWMGIPPKVKYDPSEVDIETINIILKDLCDSDEFWEENSQNIFGF